MKGKKTSLKGKNRLNQTLRKRKKKNCLILQFWKKEVQKYKETCLENSSQLFFFTHFLTMIRKEHSRPALPTYQHTQSKHRLNSLRIYILYPSMESYLPFLQSQ